MGRGMEFGVCVATVLGVVAPSQAQEARLRHVKLEDYRPEFDLWGSIRGVFELEDLEGADQLGAGSKEPKAAVVMTWRQRFELLDFSLTRNSKESFDAETLYRQDAESGIDARKDFVKTVTAVSLMFRLRGQEAKKRKEILAFGPHVFEPLHVLADKKLVKFAQEQCDMQLESDTFFKHVPASRVEEYKRTIRQYKQLLGTTSAKLTDKQRKKLGKLGDQIQQRDWWEPSLKALVGLLQKHASKGDRIALGLPGYVGFKLPAALRIRSALSDYELVYPFKQKGKRQRPPRDLPAKELIKWLRNRKRPKDTTVFVPMPLDVVDRKTWDGAAGAKVTGTWSKDDLGCTWALDGTKGEEPGMFGFAEILGEADPAKLEAVRCDLPKMTSWGNALTLFAALKIRGAEKIRLRAVK